MENEVWKDIYFTDKGFIYDYVGYYQISNLGNIKTIKRKDTNNHLVKERIKNQRIDKDGYKIVTLYKNCKKKDFKVHRLVCMVFRPDRTNFKFSPVECRSKINLDNLEVNHKDENPSNNNLDNLEWVTSKYNINYGSRNLKNSKRVNQYDIDNNFLKTWNSISEVKRELGYDVSSIVKCCKNKSKSSYGYKWRYVDINTHKKLVE